MDPKVYVASLSDYNNGTLHGVWIDLENKTKDEVWEEIEDMLKESPHTKATGWPAEEWAAHDYKDMPDGLGEHPDLDELCSIAEGVTEHGDPFIKWVENEPGHNTDIKSFEEQYRGSWKSLSEYVQDLWENQFGYEPDKNQWWHPSNYVDWERMASDLEKSGDVTVLEGDAVYVFDNH